MNDNQTETDPKLLPQESTQELSYNYQWVKPFIEGMPPSPRGGHTATKFGRFIVVFGVS